MFVRDLLGPARSLAIKFYAVDADNQVQHLVSKKYANEIVDPSFKENYADYKVLGLTLDATGWMIADIGDENAD